MSVHLWSNLTLSPPLYCSATRNQRIALCKLQVNSVVTYTGIWTPCVTALIGPVLANTINTFIDGNLC